MKSFWAKVAIAAVLLGGALIFFLVSVSIPDLNNFEERQVIQSTKIYDRTGKILLYDVHGEEKRTVIPFNQIPRDVKNATIALEDDNFYQHFGIRPLSLLRAFVVDLFHLSPEQGGSTITQQLVKQTLLTPERTVLRKIKELFIAIKIERIYTKDQILDFYLNQMPYGSSAYGIEAAAETFFNKHAQDLTTKEAAYLASLLRAPSYYSPYGKHRAELDARADFTLSRMHELGFLTDKEYKDAKSEVINFSPASAQGILAPHFVIEVKDQLGSMLGEDAIATGGFKVTTTLDADLQQKTEEVISKYADSNEKNFNASNEAAVIIDPKTGDILAMAGSRNYFDVAHEGNFNITTAHRQPGSSFKPFVYATVFKKGYTPDTALFDLPTEFNPLCAPDGQPAAGVQPDKCYHPQNFDNKFRGPVTLREALAQSLNVPSVKVLYLAGLDDSLATARDFGITSLNDPQRYGLTLVLGGGEVSLLELTSAYSVFADDGVRNPYRYILSIEDASGNNVYAAQNQPQEVIDKNIARTISDILSDNKARAPSFGEFSALYFPDKKVAAKTGTTNDFRDAWVLGYTSDVAVGAWAGNNDNTPMAKKVAGFIVAPWWHEIMDYAASRASGSSTDEFIAPDPMPEPKPYLRGEWRGGEEFAVDKISGKLATQYTPLDLQEKKVVQSVHSILYWINQADPQFKNWETPVRAWASTNGFYDQTESVIPKSYDDVHVPANFPQITGAELIPQKSIYKTSDGLVIQPAIASRYGIVQVDYFANDEYLGSAKIAPYNFAFPLSRMNFAQGIISIRLKAYDSVGNTAEYSTSVNLSN